MTVVKAAAVLLAASVCAWAHHAFAAEYDDRKLVTLSGVVTKFEWVNPHAWLNVAGEDSAGKPVQWSFEMGSPGGLLRRGWKKTDAKEGDHVTIDGYAAKDGRNVANARIVVLADGRKLFGGFQSTPRTPAK